MASVVKNVSITDEQIEQAFKGTNFGPQGETPEGRKSLVAGAVFKKLCNYSSGYTISVILRELGLTNMKGRPSAGAVRWIYEFYNNPDQHTGFEGV